MANAKLTAVSATGEATGDDVLYIVTGSATCALSRSITAASLLRAFYGADTPTAPGATGAAGTASPVSRQNHRHQGLNSVNVASSSPIFGNVFLVPGAGVNLAQSSGSITVSASGAANVLQMQMFS